MTSSARDSKSLFQKLSIGNTPGLPLACFPTNSETDPLSFSPCIKFIFSTTSGSETMCEGEDVLEPPGDRRPPR